MLNLLFEIAPYVALTIMHMLWIGAMIGILSWIGERSTRKFGSRVYTYNWNLACFASLVLSVPVATAIAIKTSPNDWVLTKVYAPSTLTTAADLSPSLHGAPTDAFRHADESSPSNSPTPSTDSLVGSAQPTSSNRQPGLTNTTNQSTSLTAEESGRKKKLSGTIGSTPSTQLKAATPNASRNTGSPTSVPFKQARRFKFIAFFVVAVVYLVTCLLLLLRVLLSALGCHRLVRSSTSIDSNEFQKVMKEASRAAALKVTPAIRSCSRLAAPVLVGLLKPVVMIPASLVTQLPPEQLRAILIHEMAHIRRLDHYTVIGQRIVEALLFFHPVTWWLSRKLDRQREYCCDEVVMRSGISPQDYAQSLYEVARHVFAGHGKSIAKNTSMAADGGDASQLLSRIDRILVSKPDEFRTKAAGGYFSILGCIFVPVSLILAFAFTNIDLAGLNRGVWNQSALNRSDQIRISSTAGANFTSAGNLNADASRETVDNVSEHSISSNEYANIRVVVRDQQMRPVAGARVYIQEHPYKYPGTKGTDGKTSRTREDLELLAIGKTDMQGQIEFEGVPIPKYKSYLNSPFPITIVADHPEYAIQWTHHKYIPRRELVVQLQPPSKSSFKIKSRTSKESLDAKIQVIGFMPIHEWNSRVGSSNQGAAADQIYLGLVRSPIDKNNYRSTPVTEKKDSSFYINRIPPDCLAVLRISAENHVSRLAYFATNQTNMGADVESKRQSPVGQTKELVTDGQTVFLEPSARVRLSVSGKDSDIAIDSVDISAYQFNSSFRKIEYLAVQKMDQGSFELKGVDGRQDLTILISPTENSLWLPQRRTISKTEIVKLDAHKFELSQGVAITGTVLDRETHKGIAGAQITFAGNRNKSPSSADKRIDKRQTATVDTTDSKGRFRIVAEPGSGKIQITQPVNGYRPSKKYKSSSRFASLAFDATNRNSSDAEPIIELEPHPEPTLRISVTRLDGRPVQDVVVRFFGILKRGGMAFPQTQLTNEQGRVETGLAQMLFMYRKIAVVAMDSHDRLAGVAAVEFPSDIRNPDDIKSFIEKLVSKKTNPKAPEMGLDIQLEPMAELTGQVISAESGSPVARATIVVRQRPTEGMTILHDFMHMIESDDNGNYRVDVIPGLEGYATASHPNFIESNQLAENDFFTLEKGERVSRSLRMVSKQATVESEIQDFEAPDLGNRTGIQALAFLKERYAIDQSIFAGKIAETKDLIRRQQIGLRQSPAVAYIQRAIELADSCPDNKTIQAQALTWACNLNINTVEDVKKRYALRSKLGERILKNHLDSVEIESCLAHLIYSQKDSKAVAEKIVRLNPSRNVQGKAIWELARMHLRHVGLPIDGQPKTIWRGKMTDQELKAAAREYCMRIKKDYGQVPYWRYKTLGKVAEMQLFELDHLDIGNQVVDIAAKDVNGAAMQLSDFKGQFIVLDFWGSWCGPCIRDLPKLNRIAESHAGDVTVVGVMNDSPDAARQAIKKHNVSWRNWAEEDNGPIQTRWNIDSWPTTYLIDRDGRIIAKGLRGEKLERKIESLLDKEKEVDQKSKSHQSADDNHLVIHVVDNLGRPVPESYVRVHAINIRPTPKPDIPEQWERIGQFKTDMAGSVVVKLPDTRITNLVLIASNSNVSESSDRDLAGIRRVYFSSEDRDQPVEVELKPTRTVTGSISDYDTKDPIAGAEISGRISTGIVGSIPLGNRVVTDARGRFSLAGIPSGLAPNIGLRVQATHKDYQVLKGFSARIKANETEIASFHLLSKSAYDRAIRAAKLAMPDTSDLPPEKAFNVLKNRYAQDLKQFKQTEEQLRLNSGDPIDKLLYSLRMLPKEIYRQQILEIAGHQGNEEYQLDALLWLMVNSDYDNRNADAQVCIELVNRFSKHEKIRETLLHIRSFHPQPRRALQKIVNENPSRDIRGLAMMQIYYSVSNIRDNKNLRENHVQQRKVLETISTDFADVIDGQSTLGETAKFLLHRLDQFGIGGTPPNFSSKSLAGNFFDLQKNRGKIVIIHYWDTKAYTARTREFDALKKIAADYADQVQIVGIVHGDQAKIEREIKKQFVSWPILLDAEHPGGFTFYIGTRTWANDSKTTAIQWGDRYTSSFRQRKTIVLTPDGKIYSMGNSPTELLDIIPKMVNDD